MESKTQLDYRFAWRWLLPIRAEDQIMLRGFTKHELAFWKEILGHAAVTEAEEKVTVLVVNNLLPDCITGYSFKCLRSFCIIGSNSIVTAWRKWGAVHFLTVNNYALLSPNNPRIVVPLGVNDWVVKSLALHRPGRKLARIILSILKGLVQVGFDWPLRTRMLCIANKDADVLPQGAVKSVIDMKRSDAPRDFALYFGTPDDNRKTVVLPLGGMDRTIFKIGDSPRARVALLNEASALETMNQSALAGQVPVLFDTVQKEGQTTLQQEFRPRRYISTTGLKLSVVNFLVELSQIGRCEYPLVEVIDQSKLMTSGEAHNSGDTPYAIVRDRLDLLATLGTKVWGHRSHGDFTPWNCAWTAKGFFVFDWEESQPWDVALADAFYFVLAPMLHIRRHRKPNLAQIMNDAVMLGTAVAERDGLTGIDINLHFALWTFRNCDRHSLFSDMLKILDF